MLKMWNSLSSEERDRRRKLLVSKYYGGDFEAFQRDVEKRPFRVLSALLALGAEAGKPVKPEKAEKPKPRPKTKAKPKAERKKPKNPPKHKTEEAKHEKAESTTSGELSERRLVEEVVGDWMHKLETVREGTYSRLSEKFEKLRERFEKVIERPKPEDVEMLRTDLKDLERRIKSAKKMLNNLYYEGLELYKKATDLDLLDTARRIHTKTLGEAHALKNLEFFTQRINYMNARLSEKESEVKPRAEKPKGRPVTKETILEVFKEYITKPFVGMTYRTLIDILKEKGYDVEEGVYDAFRELENEGRLIRIGTVGLSYVYSLPEITPRMRKEDMEPKFYNRILKFKVKTEDADEVKKVLERVEPPPEVPETLRKYYKVDVTEMKRGPKVTELWVEIKYPMYLGGVAEVENWVENQARLMGKHIFDIMKRYRAKIVGDDERVHPVEEYEREKLREVGRLPEEEKQPVEPKQKPEIGYYQFLTAEELMMLSDEELKKYEEMMGRMLSKPWVLGDEERWERYRSELGLITEEKNRRIIEKRRKQVRELLNKDVNSMGLEELEEYRGKLRKLSDEIMFSGMEQEWRELRKREKEVEKRIEELETSMKRSLLEKAKAGTLTFEETPDENPFSLSFHPSDKKEAEEALAWEIMYPYVEAKRRTRELIKIMRELGEEPDVEKVFQDYVKVFKSGKPLWEHDPYRKYWDLEERALSQFVDKMDILLQRELIRRAGDVETWDEKRYEVLGLQPYLLLDKFKGEDRVAAKLALMRILKRDDYRVLDFRSGKPKPIEEMGDYDYIMPPWKASATLNPKTFRLRGSKRNSTGKGLRALKQLDLLREGSIVLHVTGDRGEVAALTPDHVSMFKGEVDVSALGLEPGDYKVYFIGGEASALTNPDAVVKIGGNSYVFKKFTGDKVKEYVIEVEKSEEPPEKPLELKVDPRNWIGLDARNLRKLLRNADEYDILKIIVKNGKPTLALVGGKEVLGKLKSDELVFDVRYEDGYRVAEPNFTVAYNVGKIKDLLRALNPSARLHIYFDKDKPMKVEVEDEHIEGEWWLAPYVEPE